MCVKIHKYSKDNSMSRLLSKINNFFNSCCTIASYFNIMLMHCIAFHYYVYIIHTRFYSLIFEIKGGRIRRRRRREKINAKCLIIMIDEKRRSSKLYYIYDTLVTLVCFKSRLCICDEDMS